MNTTLVVIAIVLVAIAVAPQVLARYDDLRLRRAHTRAEIRNLKLQGDSARGQAPIMPVELAPERDQSIEPDQREARRMPHSRRLVVPEPPEALVRSVEASECVLFAGAGLAAQAGYPTYRDLVTESLAGAERQDPRGPWRDVSAELGSGELDGIVDLLRLRLGDDTVAALMRDSVERAAHGRSSTLDTLRHLEFAGVVTSDWSGFVVDALDLTSVARLSPTESERGIDVLRSSSRFVLEASGRLSEGSFLVTADDMYQAALAYPQYGRLLSALVSTRSLLFVGASLQGVEQFMGAIRRFDSRRRHWALVPRETLTVVERERVLARFGVELLVYDSGEDQEAATTKFAERLRQLVQLPASPPLNPVERVTEVWMKNIGPFEHLELTFGDRTILLGDNASGKSTVLKAVALALLADLAPQELAGRMLRAGENRGEIVLQTTRDSYSLALVREEGDVVVRAAGFAPIQVRPWFAIGFPPIRGTSSRRSNGPTPREGSGPSPRDLIPMLDPRADDRLDGLKQWVINSELQAAENPAARMMLDRFFAIVGDLTPGVDFDYRGVDLDTWDILLLTADGMISLDLLSRGMTALLAWIGVLLQRLYEVYDPSDGVPEHQRALVLVDEIDVHLHPEWQRLILPLVEKHFPNVQLLATTHSPLIVGSAGSGDVRLLRRDRNGLSAHVVSHRFEGWRSDQILTSEAFGMETTRDPHTAARQEEYRELMARGENPEDNAEVADLQHQLERVLPDQSETPVARQAAGLFRDWLENQMREAPADERARVLGEAEQYLRRLNASEEA